MTFEWITNETITAERESQPFKFYQYRNECISRTDTPWVSDCRLPLYIFSLKSGSNLCRPHNHSVAMAKFS